MQELDPLQDRNKLEVAFGQIDIQIGNCGKLLSYLTSGKVVCPGIGMEYVGLARIGDSPAAWLKIDGGGMRLAFNLHKQYADWPNGCDRHLGRLLGEDFAGNIDVEKAPGQINVSRLINVSGLRSWEQVATFSVAPEGHCAFSFDPQLTRITDGAALKTNLELACGIAKRFVVLQHLMRNELPPVDVIRIAPTEHLRS